MDDTAGAASASDLIAMAATEIDHAVLITDPDEKILYANRAFQEMFGYPVEEMRGCRAGALLSSEGFDDCVLGRIRTEIRAGRTFEEEVPILSRGGETTWVSAAVKPVHSAGQLHHCLIVLSDINDSKQIQAMQRDVLEAVAENRSLREVMDLLCRRVEAIAPDVVCSILAVDGERRLRPLAAPSLPAHFSAAIDGIAIGPAVGSCGTAAFRNEPVVVEDIETDPLWEDFKSLPLPLGLLSCWSTPITRRDGCVVGTFAFYYGTRRGPSMWHEHIVRACVGLCAVALERDEDNKRIARLAYYDSLTGLPNRAKLREEMEQRFDHARDPRGALLFIDIDHFKDVNDTLGHSVGDSFLKELAGRIERVVGPAGFICRHGGDEFVVFIEGVAAPDAHEIADALLRAVAEPVHVEGVMLPASASIGISLCPDHGTDSATLLRNADMAMYRAKGEGRSTYRFFTPDMNRAATDRLLLGTLLRDAVATGQIKLAYQPQVDARTGAIVGAEALARWYQPALGQIPPSRFIPLAEDAGLIEAIGDFCIGEACRQLRAWDDAGLRVEHLAVNISALQFRNPMLPVTVGRALARNRLDATRLTVEVTESVMMDAFPTGAENAARLREMGVSISMDDFGTGYSSLSHLAKLPVSELKIDRSFMADLEESEAVRTLVTAVIRIGEALRLRVVAEGVETAAQRRFLEALGCDVLQGFLFGKAMPADEFTTWLVRAQADERAA